MVLRGEIGDEWTKSGQLESVYYEDSAVE